MFGVDVSEYQPADILERVPYDFAGVKLTEGTSYVNPNHVSQASAVIAQNKPLYVYHYSDGKDVGTEVDHFISVWRQYGRRALPMLDWEGGALRLGSEWAYTWCDFFAQQIGVRPVIYGSLSVIERMRNTERHIIASYGSNPDRASYTIPSYYPAGAVAVQYSSRGILRGYTGYLDLNYSNLNINEWNALCGQESEYENMFIWIVGKSGVRNGGVYYVRNGVASYVPGITVQPSNIVAFNDDASVAALAKVVSGIPA